MDESGRVGVHGVPIPAWRRSSVLQGAFFPTGSKPDKGLCLPFDEQWLLVFRTRPLRPSSAPGNWHRIVGTQLRCRSIRGPHCRFEGPPRSDFTISSYRVRHVPVDGRPPPPPPMADAVPVVRRQQAPEGGCRALKAPPGASNSRSATRVSGVRSSQDQIHRPLARPFQR